MTIVSARTSAGSAFGHASSISVEECPSASQQDSARWGNGTGQAHQYFETFRFTEPGTSAGKRRLSHWQAHRCVRPRVESKRIEIVGDPRNGAMRGPAQLH